MRVFASFRQSFKFCAALRFDVKYPSVKYQLLTSYRSVSNKKAPVKHSKKVRQLLLSEIKARMAADSSMEAIIAPLQQLVKEQVGSDISAVSFCIFGSFC